MFFVSSILECHLKYHLVFEIAVIHIASENEWSFEADHSPLAAKTVRKHSETKE